MQLSVIAATLAIFFISIALAQSSVTVGYDQTYDDSTTSLSTVSCSDGTYGLETKGYTTFGSLPDFPYIGAAEVVTGWNSSECGTCWQLTYGNATINVLAIDHAGSGFNIALEAMNTLTNNQAEALGRVTATVTQVDASVCGL